MIPLNTLCWVVRTNSGHTKYLNHTCTVVRHGDCGDPRHRSGSPCIGGVRMHDGVETCVCFWSSLIPIVPPRPATIDPERIFIERDSRLNSA